MTHRTIDIRCPLEVATESVFYTPRSIPMGLSIIDVDVITAWADINKWPISKFGINPFDN